MVIFLTVYNTVWFIRLLALDDASIYVENVKFGSVDAVVDLDFTEQGGLSGYFEVLDGRNVLVLHKDSTVKWYHQDETSTSWRDNGVVELHFLSEVYQLPHVNQSIKLLSTGTNEPQGEPPLAFAVIVFFLFKAISMFNI